jgi:hypothetical protein
VHLAHQRAELRDAVHDLTLARIAGDAFEING